MKKIFSKKPVHAVIWAGLAAYLALYDPVSARFFIKVGKAVTVESAAYTESDMNYNIDRFAVVRYEGQYVYQLTGWAFVPGSAIPVEEYGRQVVLADPRGTSYVFAAQAIEKRGLEEAFPGEGTELDRSGFSAYISKLAVPRGTYRVGIVYTAPDSSAAFHWTEQYIVRSANALKMVGYSSTIDDSLDDWIQKIRLLVGLQAETEMVCYFDRIDLVRTEGRDAYILYGWAFPAEGDVPLDQYQRRVVLLNEKRIPYLLDASPRRRPDVQAAQADRGQDVLLSGFTARMFPSFLPPGLYRLGILYTAGRSSSVFDLTEHCIQWAPEGLTLIKCPAVGGG